MMNEIGYLMTLVSARERHLRRGWEGVSKARMPEKVKEELEMIQDSISWLEERSMEQNEEEFKYD